MSLLQVREQFPWSVRQIENTWITLSDGTRLAARLWLPVGAEEEPVPAILEYLPYRKNDYTASYDAQVHPYFAGHGYASIRVDIRGSGESDGILYDEYLQQEQDDALEVLAWIARQPWCTGDIGMIGASWGGFNGLQVAACQPPQLKAVVSLCSTDDRYADDVHYIGGSVLGDDMLPWASTMLAMNARPPDPLVVGERWRKMWLERLESTPPFIETWLSHQRRDAYWKHGSVCEDFAAIKCPVYAVGGWSDGYTNAILRLLAGLTGPRKGLIGPWAHTYPHRGIPEPAIGFLQECLRWWDHWLKGEDTGIMKEPMLLAWMQESVEPKTCYEERPGRWVAEPHWPPENNSKSKFHLNPEGTLAEEAEPGYPQEIAGTLASGRDAGVWCPYGTVFDWPADQRSEDGLSFTFTSAPLRQPMEILGFPEVEVTVAADQPNALLAVRLCDVSPTGSSLLVTRGILNLTHRDSHEHPIALDPGQPYAVTLRMDAIAHSFPAGHRVRLAVTPAYWPRAWPSPKPVTLILFTGDESRVYLPVRTARTEDSELASFGPPEGAPPLATNLLRNPLSERSLLHEITDSGSREVEVRELSTGRRRLVASGLSYELSDSDHYSTYDDDPLSVQVRCDRTVVMERGDWRIRVETTSTMSADEVAFYVTNTVDAYEGVNRVFAKARDAKIPRDLV